MFGPTGAIAGRLFGALAGNVIDQYLFGARTQNAVDGPRLADPVGDGLDRRRADPAALRPRRLSGQVIWATNLEEVVNTDSQTTGGKSAGGGSGGSSTTTTTTYSYFANFAVGLCEGPISCVLRVWADGKPLDLTASRCASTKATRARAPTR